MLCTPPAPRIAPRQPSPCDPGRPPSSLAACGNGESARQLARPQVEDGPDSLPTLEDLKGKPLPAVCEAVMNGSCLRISANNGTTNFTLFLAGRTSTRPRGPPLLRTTYLRSGSRHTPALETRGCGLPPEPTTQLRV